jgi:uroporphyrinogen decarboxylase
MPITHRENWLRTIEFRYPEWIPCSIALSPITWSIYRQDLEEIALAHPRIFPGYERPDPDFYQEMPPVYRSGEYFLDNWGCLWYNQKHGLEGQVVRHPLADWSALDAYRLPDPMLLEERGIRDWDEISRNLTVRRSQGHQVMGNGERLFDRLYFLRGFENLMFDFAEGRPELSRLICMLEAYELDLVRRWLEFGVDCIGFHTDIGTQRAPMIGSKAFRRYLKPTFTRIFQTCRAAGAHVYLSSDGNLLELVDDLIECGISAHDPQLRACTLPGIVKAYKGKVCANVDLDRQGFPFATPAAIREEIKQVVDMMAAPEGGLMVQAAVYGDDVPLANVVALCEAMEDYCY